MNIHAPLDSRRYDTRLWWVILAGLAARFSAEREPTTAATGFALWFVLLLGCWIVRAFVSAGPDTVRRQQKAGNVIAVVGLVSFLLQLNGSGLLPALLTFLFAVQAAVFVSAVKRLHAWLILAAALAGVLFAAAESRSPLFLVAAAWFTFAGLGVLSLDQRIERERAMLLKHATDSARVSSGGGFAFAVIVLLLSIPIYLFLPKPAGLLLGGMQAQTARELRDRPGERAPDQIERSTSESSREMSDQADQPSDSSIADPQRGDYDADFSPDDVRRDLSTANIIVLYVKSTQPTYLRGLTYDRFENHRWHRDATPFDVLKLERGNATLATHGEGERIQQTIELVADLGTTVWHAPGASKLRFPAAELRRYEDDVLIAPQSLTEGTVYSVESRSSLESGRYRLTEARSIDVGRYLRTDGASDRLRALAASLTASVNGPKAKAVVLEQHLREHYQYTYETIPQQGYTPLDTFLFETRRGHCEYFASALAMLLRAVDIPSRVVTGFSLGEANPMTGYYEVRGLDGHAWVEAYVDGGWMMLEPTPFYPLPASSSSTQVASQMDRYLERLAQNQALLAPESISAAITRELRDSWLAMRDSMSAIVDRIEALGWTLVAWVVGGATTLVLLYVAALASVDGLENRAVRASLARTETADDPEAVLLTAQALETAGAQRGFARDASMSFREYAAVVPREIAIGEDFLATFDEARYGAAMQAARSRAVLQPTIASIQAQLKADPWPRTRRALGAALRSVLEVVGRR